VPTQGYDDRGRFSCRCERFRQGVERAAVLFGYVVAIHVQWLIETEFIPAGYVLVVASAGVGAPSNVVALREHTNSAYRGLRLIPGNQGPYLLTDSFLMRTVGVGVLHRSAAVAVQVKASGTYDVPSIPR
jgi:hypothetical protein